MLWHSCVDILTKQRKGITARLKSKEKMQVVMWFFKYCMKKILLISINTPMHQVFGLMVRCGVTYFLLKLTSTTLSGISLLG